MKKQYSKRMGALFLALAILATCMALPVSAGDVIASGSCGGSTSWELSQENDGYCLTLYGSGTTSNYNVAQGDVSRMPPWHAYLEEITEVVIGKDIVGLGNQCFYGASSLKKVTFEAGSQLQTVGSGTFRLCTALEEIRFPGSLTKVGGNAFTSCENLKLVDFGRGAASGVTFANIVLKFCINLDTLYLPANVKDIDNNSFYTIYNLRDVYYYGTSIESYTEMLRNTKDPDLLASPEVNVYVWDEAAGAFSTTAQHPGASACGTPGSDVTAYMDYSQDPVVLKLHGGGSVAGYASAADAQAAPWADSLNPGKTVETVVVFENVQAIGDYAFADCASIGDVIYFGSAESWDALIAASGTGNEALFSKTPQFLLTGSCGDQTTYALSSEDNGNTYCLTVSGTGKMADYESKEQPWYFASSFITKVVVEDGVTAIGEYCFDRLSRLSEVELAGSVRYCATYSLRGSQSLRSISFPEGFENIGCAAFSACTALEELHFPSTMRIVDLKAFEYCTGLKTIYFAGTSYQWDAQMIIDNTNSLNDNLLACNVVYETPPEVTTAFSDAAASPYADSLQYLYVRGLYENLNSTRFGTTLPQTAHEVLRALYAKAGSDNLYADSLDWAARCGLMSAVPDTLTLDEMAGLLYRTAQYNGHSVSVTAGVTLPEAITGSQDETALLWAYAKGYLTDLLANKGQLNAAAELTREEGAAILTAYLNSEEAAADRRAEIVATLRSAVAAGGDGKMYVAGVNLMTPGLAEKVGDCTLVVFPDGQVMLIDAGVAGASPTLIQFLRDVGITSLDYLVITHGHGDHMGGALAVCQYIYEEAGGTVGCFWYSGAYQSAVSSVEAYLNGKGVSKELQFLDVTEENETLSDIKTYAISDDVEVAIFCPNLDDIANVDSDGNTDAESVNNTSIGMKFTYGTSTFLSAGDCYVSKERDLVENFGSWLQSDVIKANHHGNYQSSCQEWLDTVQPQICFADIDGNGNGVVAERYRDAGCMFFTTGFDGTVLVTMDDASNYTVEKELDGILRMHSVLETVELAADSPSAPTSSSVSPNYSIASNSPQNGNVSINPANAQSGATVTVEVIPDSGYRLDSLTVTDQNGSEIPLTSIGDGRYTFVMPDSRVRVEAQFVARSAEFTDVPEGQWYTDAVDYVVRNGLMEGTGTAVFSPFVDTTRGMIVTILWRMEGKPAGSGGTFADVADGSWYEEAVGWAAANGIVNGYPGSVFRPEAPISREEMAAILYRYAVYKGYDVSVGEDTNILSYFDFSEISEYAIPSLQWACGAGLIQGVSEGRLDPQGSAIRAQAAAILMRFCETVAR